MARWLVVLACLLGTAFPWEGHGHSDPSTKSVSLSSGSWAIQYAKYPAVIRSDAVKSSRVVLLRSVGGGGDVTYRVMVDGKENKIPLRQGGSLLVEGRRVQVKLATGESAGFGGVWRVAQEKPVEAYSIPWRMRGKAFGGTRSLLVSLKEAQPLVVGFDAGKKRRQSPLVLMTVDGALLKDQYGHAAHFGAGDSVELFGREVSIHFKEFQGRPVMDIGGTVKIPRGKDVDEASECVVKCGER